MRQAGRTATPNAGDEIRMAQEEKAAQDAKLRAERRSPGTPPDQLRRGPRL